nr:fibronectin type III domain-containing protein [Paenibacillus sp.]
MMRTRKRIGRFLTNAGIAFTLLLPVVPVQSALAATINVTTYGANGGDGADDRAALQNAINAASSGDTVYLPAGTYYLASGGLVGKSGIKIQGEHRDTTIVRYTATTDGLMLNLNNTSGTEVSRLTFWGNNHTLAGINVDNSGANQGNHKFHHNLFKEFTKSDGFAPFGIMTANSDNNEITDNEFINMGVNSTWGAGIRAGWNSNGTKILRNIVDGSGRGAIFANDGCQNVVVSNNTATRSGLKEHGLSIELHTNCNHSVVEDNHVDHWLSVVRSQYTATRRNFVGTNDGTVQGMGLEIMAPHSIATDNIVDNGQQVGIQQSSGSGYQYWGYNTVKNMVMWGMQLQGEGAEAPQQYQYFYKNTFENTQRGNPAAAYPGYDGNAVRIHGNSLNMTFDSNTIKNNGRKAIEITTSPGTDRLSFINNVITGNQDASIDQYPSSAAHLEWSNNTVSGNGTNTQLTSRGFTNPKPTANFTAPTSVQLGQSVTFTNTSSDNGSIVENLWDFGEGVPSTVVSPTYTYQKAGTYRVTLVVWDNEGRASLKEHTINVYAGPPDTQAPSAPTNLSAPSKSNVTVDLAWSASTDNVGVYGYEVYKNGTLAGATTGANATTFTVTGLTPSTTYGFTVKAKDAAGNVSAASNTLSVTTDAGDTQPPTAPANLTSTGKTDTSVSLSWSASTDNMGVTGYDIYAGSTLVSSTTGASGTNHTVTGLAPSTTYSFTVKAKDASNNVSAASNAVSVTTDPLANWVNCAGENQTCSFAGTKEVRYGANGSYVKGTFTNSVVCSNNAFGTDPAPGYYKTCDVNLAGTGGGGGDTQAPTAPSNLTSPSKTSNSVSLSWSASSDNAGVTGYDVYNGSSLAGTTTNTTFTVSGLSASTTYTFTVKAKDAAGNVSAASNAVTVTTNASSSANWVPCAGENQTCSFSGTKEVRYGANGSYAYGTFTNSVVCGNNVFGDPAPGQYKTCDVNEGGSGGGSDTQAPAAPSNLTSPSKTSTSVSLSWSASTDNVGVTGYDVYNGSSLAGSTSGTGFTVSGLTANTAYTFTVKAKDAANNVSAASNAVTVTTDASSGGGGSVVREYWTGIGGSGVSSIPLGSAPTGTDTLTSLQGPTNWNDNYGTRIRGYITPATSGSYTFYISGDDESQFWLSANDNPANKTMIANVHEYTDPLQWNKFPNQQSGAISLTGGQAYYFEILHKEGGGGDNLAVGWTGPGISSIAVISGSYLSAY